jgi:hypothetical protein
MPDRYDMNNKRKELTMDIITQIYEQAKFADIERHVTQENQALEYLEDELNSKHTTQRVHPKRKFSLVLWGLLSLFANPTFR